ncbi:MAG: riboflavin synthase [Bdellovibrionaceae bacterium]|jgi:riboflavin synthase|nr:riboflavin synthase [Pseudobdellovibrionaceae bacterium]
MFSGIIEVKSKIIHTQKKDSSLVIEVQRPASFDDIKVGDSIALNGICLTVEKFDAQTIQFTIGFETLKITNWSELDLVKLPVNLERSLRFGDRIHGHMVTGHVDAMVSLKDKVYKGECLILKLKVPKKLEAFIWNKGSVTLNGVSLTVNNFNSGVLEVCLIPETLRQTNLESYEQSDLLTLEIDNFSRAIYRYFETHENNKINIENVKEPHL